MLEIIDERERICQLFNQLIGEGGCGVSCAEPEFFKENGQWKMFLSGFMEPWPMGATIEEVEASLREYAGMGFGLS